MSPDNKPSEAPIPPPLPDSPPPGTVRREPVAATASAQERIERAFLTHIYPDKIDAKLVYDQVMRDRSHAFWNRNDPDHNEAVRRQAVLAEYLAGPSRPEEPDDGLPAEPRNEAERKALDEAGRMAESVLDQVSADREAPRYSKEHPLWNRNHPQHDQAVKEWNDLVGIADAARPQYTDAFGMRRQVSRPLKPRPRPAAPPARTNPRGGR